MNPITPGVSRLAACRWLPLLAALALGTAAGATEPGLPLAQAVEAAVTRSLALQALARGADAARERAVAAGQRPDPMLELGVENLPVEGGTRSLLTREGMTQRSIALAQEWPDAAKRRARAEAVERDAGVAEARAAVLRAQLRREAALAWWALRGAREALTLLDAQRDEAQRLVQAADAQLRGGGGGADAPFEARAALARLDGERIAVLQRIADARAALRRWLGEAAEADPQPRPWPQALPLDAAQQQRDDPELALADARVAAAVALAGLADQERRPDWRVTLRFGQRGPQYDNVVGLMFSRPLRWDPPQRQDRELAARLAERAAAEAERDELRRERAAELQRLQQRWRALRALLAQLDAERLPLAASRTQAALAAYAAGSGPLAAVLAARQAELALRQERLQLEMDAAAEWSRWAAWAPHEGVWQ